MNEKFTKPSILLLLAYKNLFQYSHISLYSDKLLKWAKSPTVPDLDVEGGMLSKVKAGLDLEIALPEYYKAEALEQIRDLYIYNTQAIMGD